MKNIKRLKQLMNSYPELTFDNKGYQYLSAEIKESHKEIIEEIESILENIIKGFSNFDNFKPRKDKENCIRCQYRWDTGFYGVGYFTFEDLEIRSNIK